MQVSFPYHPVSDTLLAKAKEIKLIAFDVDGVFSDGRIYLGNQGEEYKAFNTLDGYGIKAIMKLGVEVAVITGRRSKIVTQRMGSLGVRHVIQGEEDKRTALSRLQKTLTIPREQTASMGDDMPDLGMFAHSALNFGVPDGHPLVNQHADYITRRSGGAGAVREVCDLLLAAHGELQGIHGSSV